VRQYGPVVTGITERRYFSRRSKVSEDDQRAVIAHLSCPRSYDGGVTAVEVITTHASMVFLAGDHAFKLKRAVKYAYLDFSTPALRRDACGSEFALNRRTAAGLYLAVRSLNRLANGEIAFDGPGPALDWVVVMRRFDQSGLFDRLAADGALTAPLMTRLADRIAAFHDGAQRTPEHGGRTGIADVLAINETALAGFTPPIFEPRKVSELCAETKATVRRMDKLLERRRLAGKVRHCHGDLHLGNISLVDGDPILFDCIEFNRPLACIDVLYDLAFLLMDLEHRGQRHFANLVFNRYLDRSNEADGIGAIGLFASLRAAVRAHVKATAAGIQPDPALRRAEIDQAQSYLGLAGRLLRRASPRLIAVGGLSGTGKSTLAASLAPAIGTFPGARVLRSDVRRKRLLGIPLEERCSAAGYTEAVTSIVYGQMRRLAAEALAVGHSVILDAVAADPAERKSFADTALAAGVPFTGLWLEASPPLLDQRIRNRRNDVSDATPDVLRQQLGWNIGRLDWTTISTDGDLQTALAAASCVVGTSEAS
jgi:aminoglycoside phosphotransferase family enzyme/predicted kinase